MQNAGTLKITMPTEREVVLTRVFDAPRSLVFDALTKPEGACNASTSLRLRSWNA